MRLSILLPSMKFGGAEKAALYLARALRSFGLEVEFLLMSYEGELLAEAAAEFGVVDLRCDRTWKLPHRLLKRFSEKKSDILLSSFWKLNLCACLAAMLLPRTKLILWEHGEPSHSEITPNFLYAVTSSILYRQADTMICVSGGVRDDIARLTVGLGSRLRVIHNPIASPPPFLGLPHLPQGKKQIVWVGRLADQKNPGLLLEAFARIADEVDARVVYVGDGPLRGALEQRCRELGLADRVSFAGFQPSPYVIIADSNVLVLTSDSEGLGNVLVEGMYCGLGIVSTDCGQGVHEVLLGSKHGTIVPRGDAPALARGMMRELSHPRDPLFQMQRAERFRPEAVAASFLEAFGGAEGDPRSVSGKPEQVERRPR